MKPVKSTWLLFLSAVATTVVTVTAAPPAQERDPFLTAIETGMPDGNLISYQLLSSPERHGAPAVASQQQEAQFVVRKTSASTLTVRERFRHFHLDKDIVIPGGNVLIPRNLRGLEGGAGYGRRLENGRVIGGNFSIGSNSDDLFHSIHETSLQATINYRVPTRPNRAWLFFLNYSNNRHFLNNIPLPGFAYYIHSPVNKIRAVVGFPFVAIFYMPTEKWTARAFAFGPRRFSFESGYRVIPPVEFYGKFDWSNLEWQRAGRNDNDDRLFFDRKRAALGVKLPVVKRVSLDTSVGREFGRRFFENDDSDHDGVPSVKLPAVWNWEAKVSTRF